MLQTEADAIMFSIVDTLRQIGYTSRVVIDSKENYAESASAASQNDGDLLIKRGGDMVYYSKLVLSDMTECEGKRKTRASVAYPRMKTL